ncbi:YgcG family protein [Starkeya sp. ORNL1]|uniref:TPM domain-containing protein n=1 Tax=Starkeya sp. ORNL1 TaxID=2709380 RepID=UPI0014648EB7|nr:YgcG family protein [Starkeya sp. ORNL1]QJP17238.1 YgcG family protein [Starkeya sp. ORNL1]
MPSRVASGLASLALAFGLAFLCLLAPARAELTFPPLTGRVVDAASILNPAARAALDAKLAAQEGKTTDQFVVATVPSLQGTSVEDYANRLFRAWKLGQGDKNNGALLLVAPNERKVRIEVGYGLEGVLTDAVTSTIIQTAMLPAFRSGDFAGGVTKGADAVIEVLNLDPEEAKARARQAEKPAMSPDDWLHLIFFVLMIAFWIYVFYRSTRGGGGPGAGYRRGRGGAVVIPGGISTWDFPRGGGGGGWSGGSGGGFSGGGGSSGGGGASGSW